MMPPWWVLVTVGVLIVVVAAPVGVVYAVGLAALVVLAYVAGWLEGRSYELDRQIEFEERLVEDLTDTALRVFDRWNRPVAEGGGDEHDPYA